MNWLNRFTGQLTHFLRRPGIRQWLPAGIGMAVVALILAAWWIPGELAALEAREVDAIGRLGTLQEKLAEIDRFKGRAPPAAVSGRMLGEAVSASLATRLPSLSARLTDSASVQVQGQADFDDFVRWLGETQTSHRVGVKALQLVRQEGAVTVDATFVGADE